MKTVRLIPKTNDIHKVFNVAAYARVSRDMEPNIHSLSSQIDYYGNLIKQNPKWSFAGVYSDSGLTGTKASRPGFQNLISDCRSGKVDIVLTKSVSRFARNTVDLLNVTRELRELRIPVIFEKERINSMTVEGELMLSLLASFAQEESHSISENIKWGIRRNFEKGRGNNFNRMYGFVWDGEKFNIVPEEAEVVKFIFSSYLDGDGPYRIASILTQRGIKNANGHDFTYSTIWGMLRCEKYAGCSLLQKTYHSDHMEKKNLTNHGELKRYWVEGTHPQIISLETFNAVQLKIKQRSSLGVRATKGMNFTVFSGKIICSCCGHTLRRNTRANGRFEYRCPTKGCTSPNVPEAKLKELSSEVLGLSQFSEEEFEKQVIKVEVSQPNKLAFFLSDGQKVIKEFKENKMNVTFELSPFTGLLVCSSCSHTYKRHQQSMKGRKTYYYKWVCNNKLRHTSSACNSPNVPEKALYDITSELLGDCEITRDLVTSTFSKIEVRKDNTLVFHFHDGRLETRSWQYIRNNAQGGKIDG